MKTPFPYWLDHAIIACIISALVTIVLDEPAAGWCAGAFFYIGREVRDYEKLGWLDWRGLVAPVVAVTLQHLVFVL